jgi:hypothetical protein
VVAAIVRRPSSSARTKDGEVCSNVMSSAHAGSNLRRGVMAKGGIVHVEEIAVRR